MKLDLLNEATAVDEKGRVWFKTNLLTPHRTWPSCSECGKRAKVFWKCYPDIGKLVCENCREELK